MLKGFREFIARGNVIDLATAVIVGAGIHRTGDGIHRQHSAAASQPDRRDA